MAWRESGCGVRDVRGYLLVKGKIWILKTFIYPYKYDVFKRECSIKSKYPLTHINNQWLSTKVEGKTFRFPISYNHEIIHILKAIWICHLS